jgi:hypothetical protein
MFRLGFNSSYFFLTELENKRTINMNKLFFKLISSITIGVFMSQFLDFIFIRITNEQMSKYSSVRDAFSKIRFEEGNPKLLMTGFGHRFLMMFFYYSMLVCTSEARRQSTQNKGLNLLLG